MKRARNVFIAAFAISLLLHLLLAGWLPWPFGHSLSETEVVSVRHVTIARIAKRTPAPAPVQPRKKAASFRTKIAPPRTTQRGSRGVPVANVASPATGKPAASTPAPVPSPTATAIAQACLYHDVTPAVSATADPPAIPPEARASKASGTASIRVEIDEQGRVTGAKLAQTSGSAGLDEVAIQMARAATYTPALVKCRPVASSYTFSVKFAAW